MQLPPNENKSVGVSAIQDARKLFKLIQWVKHEHIKNNENNNFMNNDKGASSANISANNEHNNSSSNAAAAAAANNQTFKHLNSTPVITHNTSHTSGNVYNTNAPMSSEGVNSSNKYVSQPSPNNANNAYADNTNFTNMNSSSTVHYPIKSSPKGDRYEKLSSARVQPNATRQLTTPQRRPTPLKHTNSINYLNRSGNNNNNVNESNYDAAGAVYKSKKSPRAQTALRREQYPSYNNNNSSIGEGEEKITRQGNEYKTPLRPASRRANVTPTPFNSRRMQNHGPFDNISVSSLTSGSHSHTNSNINSNSTPYYSAGVNSSVNTANNSIMNSTSSNTTSYTTNNNNTSSSGNSRHKMSRITVVVRKRPLNSSEINS